jgi:hypothetical protein
MSWILLGFVLGGDVTTAPIGPNIIACFCELQAGYAKPHVGGSELRRHAFLVLCAQPSAIGIIVFQGGDDGHGYRNTCKIPRGSDLKQGD